MSLRLKFCADSGEELPRVLQNDAVRVHTTWNEVVPVFTDLPEQDAIPAPQVENVAADAGKTIARHIYQWTMLCVRDRPSKPIIGVVPVRDEEPAIAI